RNESFSERGHRSRRRRASHCICYLATARCGYERNHHSPHSKRALAGIPAAIGDRFLALASPSVRDLLRSTQGDNRMGVVLALASAILYGIVDFTGGKLSRRIDGFTLALPVQVAGFVVMLTLAVLLQGGSSWHSLAWGALSGVGSGVAIM